MYEMKRKEEEPSDGKSREQSRGKENRAEGKEKRAEGKVRREEEKRVE